MLRRLGFLVVAALAVVLLAALALGVFGGLTASADLNIVNPPVTFQGHGGYSADGVGQNTTGNTIQAEVPAGSTVVQALLYGVTFSSIADPTIDVDFDGTLVTLTNLGSSHAYLGAYRADVTAQVATKVGAGGGITDFAINSDLPQLDGVALVVIFSNPLEPEVSIAVLDGGLSSDPSVTTMSYTQPLDKSLPGFTATMSLGSSYSAQDQSGLGGSHLCGVEANQSSIVDVNGQRLTSCAGNLDDGVGPVENGILITVGGVGDNTLNPADPLQQPADGGMPRVEDDELYDIAPFLSTGDTQTVINTQNPSGDDQIFLLIIKITAEASFTQEVCDDGIDNDGDGLVDLADPDCAPPSQPPDIAIVGQTFFPCKTPNRITVSEDTEATLRKVIHNNGPTGPVEVQASPIVFAPSGCTAWLKEWPAPVDVPVSVDVTVDEVFVLHCYDTGEKTFEVWNYIWPTDFNVIDPVWFNNSWHTSLTLEAVPPGWVDYAVTSLTPLQRSFVNPARSYIVSYTASVRNVGTIKDGPAVFSMAVPAQAGCPAPKVEPIGGYLVTLDPGEGTTRRFNVTYYHCADASPPVDYKPTAIVAAPGDTVPGNDAMSGTVNVLP